MSYTEEERPFSPEDENRIEAAIAEAERMTSGEIRIHVEKRCPDDALTRARHVFGRLQMHETAERNGVLLYVALEDHKLAVYGDEGIHATVGLNYWAGVIDVIVRKGRNGDLSGGLVDGILQIGTILKKYYPYQTDDQNELDNAVSYSLPPKGS